MGWSDVGDWLKENSGKGLALIGSLVSGNVPGAIAAGASMISSATGTDDPMKALQKLQADPVTMTKLEEIAAAKEEDIRSHIETMERMKLEDAQKEHEQTQITIRQGDTALDEKIRLVRPTMAKQSWVGTICYCIGCFGVHAINGQDLFNAYIAMVLSSPAWAYLGLRTTDKFSQAWKERGAATKK